MPAVASVFTGRTPNRHGAGSFRAPVADLGRSIPNWLRHDVETLPEILARRGFSKHAIVSQASWFRNRFGLDRGFDTLSMPATDAGVVEAARDWLTGHRENPQAPFFLYLHLMEAHRHFDWTRVGNRERAEKLTPAQRRAGIAVAPEYWCPRPLAARCQTFLAYVQAVAAQREQVAQVLSTLEALGLLGETAVILYSDHGEEFRDHIGEERAQGGHPQDHYGYGHGHAMYQELLHVPLLVWHPTHLGARVSMPVSLADILPSVLDWLQLDYDRQSYEGASWAAALTEGTSREGRARFASAISLGPEQVSVVRDGWKRVLHLSNGKRRLYNLNLDPGEKQPLQGGAVEAELDRLIDGYIAATRGGDQGAPILSAEDIRALQSLGYLEEVETP
jgi:arylsulfatase A-like enzyme